MVSANAGIWLEDTPRKKARRLGGQRARVARPHKHLQASTTTQRCRGRRLPSSAQWHSLRSRRRVDTAQQGAGRREAPRREENTQLTQTFQHCQRSRLSPTTRARKARSQDPKSTGDRSLDALEVHPSLQRHPQRRFRLGRAGQPSSNQRLARPHISLSLDPSHRSDMPPSTSRARL